MKSLLNARSQRFITVFYFKSFIALALIFQCLVHFELIFVYGVKVRVQVHSFECGYPDGMGHITIC